MPAEDDGDPFESTEEYYAEYRPGYGDEAIRYLVDRFELDDSARVLDLGCGAGQLAVPLAAHAGEVVGMDPNEAMLQQARKRAREADRENVELVAGSDADLREQLGPLRLATMGRSFHWMDQERTLDRLSEMINPDGGVALVDDTEWLTRGTADWQAEVYEVADEYLDDPPARTGPVDEHDDPWDELLADYFRDVAVETFERRREWTVEEIVGYVFSLSFCSPETFGDEGDDFESDLRARLDDWTKGETDADGTKESFVQTAEVTVLSGRRPL